MKNLGLLFLLLGITQGLHAGWTFGSRDSGSHATPRNRDNDREREWRRNDPEAAAIYDETERARASYRRTIGGDPSTQLPPAPPRNYNNHLDKRATLEPEPAPRQVYRNEDQQTFEDGLRQREYQSERSYLPDADLESQAVTSGNATYQWNSEAYDER